MKSHPHIQQLIHAGFPDVAAHWSNGTLPARPIAASPWEQSIAEQQIKDHLRQAYRYMQSDDIFPHGSTLTKSIRRMWETWDEFAK